MTDTNILNLNPSPRSMFNLYSRCLMPSAAKQPKLVDLKLFIAKLICCFDEFLQCSKMANQIDCLTEKQKVIKNKHVYPLKIIKKEYLRYNLKKHARSATWKQYVNVPSKRGNPRKHGNINLSGRVYNIDAN